MFVWFFFFFALFRDPTSSNTRRSTGGNAIIKTVLELRLVKISCLSKRHVLTSHWANKIAVGPVRNSANHQAPLNSRSRGKQAWQTALAVDHVHAVVVVVVVVHFHQTAHKSRGEDAEAEEAVIFEVSVSDNSKATHTEHCSNCLKKKKKTKYKRETIILHVGVKGGEATEQSCVRRQQPVDKGRRACVEHPAESHPLHVCPSVWTAKHTRARTNTSHEYAHTLAHRHHNAMLQPLAQSYSSGATSNTLWRKFCLANLGIMAFLGVQSNCGAAN